MASPCSVPATADPKSHRPVKRRALSPASAHAASLNALFAKPDQEIRIPSASSTGLRPLPPPPEIVANVQGSSAGAGSGEFHVYKAARRREYERLRRMDVEAQQDTETKEFERNQAALFAKDESKTNKSRLRREKARARKERARWSRIVKGRGDADAQRDDADTCMKEDEQDPDPASDAEMAPKAAPTLPANNKVDSPDPAGPPAAGILIHDQGDFNQAVVENLEGGCAGTITST